MSPRNTYRQFTHLPKMKKKEKCVKEVDQDNFVSFLKTDYVGTRFIIDSGWYYDIEPRKIN